MTYAPPTGHTIATTSAPDLRFDPSGRIAGLDGVLDQILESVGKQVTPLVRDVALPILQRDRELQKTVGEKDTQFSSLQQTIREAEDSFKKQVTRR